MPCRQPWQPRRARRAGTGGRSTCGRLPIGRTWRTVRRVCLSGCAMIIKNLSRSTGAVHVRLTAPPRPTYYGLPGQTEGPDRRHSTKRAQSGPQLQTNNDHVKETAHSNQSTGLGRTGASQPPGHHQLEHAPLARLTCCPKPSLPCVHPLALCRIIASPRRTATRVQDNTAAVWGAPAPLRSASCTFQGTGPSRGWPKGDVRMDRSPSVCCAKRVDCCGVTAGMPGHEGACPAMQPAPPGRR